MEPNCLKGCEIVYELKCRGVASAKTVDENRPLLRGALRRESLNRSFATNG